MAITRVQGTGKVRLDTGSPLVITFSTPPSVGNAVIVLVCNRRAAGPAFPTTLTDSKGNSYARAATRTLTANASAIYYCAAVGTSGTPFTISIDAGGGLYAGAAVEVSGVGAGLVLDQSATSSAGSTTITAGPTAALTADAVILAGVYAYNTTEASSTVEALSPAWVEEFEELSASAYVMGEGDTRILTSGALSTTPRAQWTVPSAGSYAACVAVFATTAAPIAIDTDPGTYAQTGSPAILTKWPPLIAAAGTYAQTGTAARLAATLDAGRGVRTRLLIDLVDQTAWLANGYGIDIEKVLSTETMHLAILDLDSTAGAYRPTVGQAVRLTRVDADGVDVELLFGGVIAQVVDEPIIDDTGTVTRLRCRDWMYLADQVFLPTRTFASAEARTMFTEIVETYLGPKGVTVISAPTGGPEAPDLRLEDPVTTVREALDRLTLNVGFPWRIAEPTSGGEPGEKWAAIVEPGELPGPATLADDGASVLTDPPLTWEKQLLTHATRVWVQTATSETNSGPVEVTESWTSDGGTSVYPVHVLPSEIRASTTAAAESLTTSLALDGLPPGARIRIGGRLTIDWHTQVYTVLVTATTDAEGKVTITVSQPLERDVPEGHSVQFKPGAFVQLEVNGVITPMDGAPYVWEESEHAIVYPGGSWVAGTTITYRTWGYHPFYIREWDPSAQQAVGWFDYATLVDQHAEDEEGHTDIDTARAFAQAELARRLTPSKRVTCTTRIPGHYPLLTVPMAFPDRLVTGDYLVTETRIRHSTIDETGPEPPWLYELVLMEGDARGESWISYFRGRNPAGGIRWGPIGVAGPGPITHVATVTAAPGVNGGTTGAIDTSLANFLVVSVSYAASGTLSDSRGNTWVPLTEYPSGAGPTQRLYYAVSGLVGTGHTFTFAGTGTQPAILVHAFANVDASTPLLYQNGGGGHGTALGVTYAAPSVPGALFISGLAAENVSALTNNQGLTQTAVPYAGGVPNYEGATGWVVQTAATGYSLTWAWTGASWCAQSGAFFKPAH